MHVAIVNLAFERTASAADLLVRYPLLTSFCTRISATRELRVSVLARFWRDDDLEVDGVRYHFRADASGRPLASPFTRPLALYRLLRDIKPDLVHVNGLVFPLHVAEMRWRLPSETPLVVQHRGERPRGLRLTWAQRAVRGCVDGFLFSGERIADRWRAVGVVGADQPVYAVLSTSSALTPVAHEAARAETGVHGDPAVLWVGRLHRYKDPLLALDAFDRARPHLRDPHLFVIFQEDHLMSDMRAFCASRPGLAERVHFVGAISHPRLATWFSAADLFITSSPAEGSNVALIESLSCGLLPVCSDNPANRLVTNAGEAGLLFPYGDAVRGGQAIVDAAGQAARDGDAGRARLRAYFDARLSWPVVAGQTLSAYRSVIATRRSRRAIER